MAHVMMVDDDEEFAVAVGEALRAAGHEVSLASEVAGVVERMVERPPDLVILDVMFPQDSSAGFELARTIRHQKGKLEHVPILMLTAVAHKFPYGFGGRDIDSESLPVNAYMEKPVEPDALVQEVARLLGQAGSQGGASSS
ncbi:MAG: response regulator transcription factor [Candidatus Brocadiia bacterium]